MPLPSISSKLGRPSAGGGSGGASLALLRVPSPLSVLSSWVNEFKRFVPSLRVQRLHSADQRERELMRTELLSDVNNFDIIVTTYEMAVSQNMKTILCHRIHWRYLVLDEGHRIKNEKTNLYASSSRLTYDLGEFLRRTAGTFPTGTSVSVS